MLDKAAAVAVDHRIVLAHAAQAAVAARAHVAAVESDDSGVDARVKIGTVTRVLRMLKGITSRRKRSASQAEKGCGHAVAHSPPAAPAASIRTDELQTMEREGHGEETHEEERKARKRAKRLKQKQKRAELGARQDWKAMLKARKDRKRERLRHKRECGTIECYSLG